MVIDFEMAGHVARMGRRGMHRGCSWEMQKERALGRLRCRWIILKCILERYDWVVWTGFIWLRIGTGGGLL
jgi:hypothetical protein